VIVENTPTYRNLFGTIEKTITPNGNWFTDFTKIRAGSILRADGGFLVFHLLDALTEPGVWKALKRTIKSRQVEIESYDSVLFYMTSSLKPQGIDVDVKLAVIGDVYLYHMLYAYDEDFKKMFKVRADFDHVMPHSDDSVYETARFVSQVVRNENLPPFDKTALAAVVEECVAMAGQQNKLTTKFSVVADIVRETAYWTVKARAKVAKAQHVLRALDARKTRSNLLEEKLQEMIDAGKILISTGGAQAGQINGLAVYQIGDYSFGKPTRITAKIGMGRAGIINIEREAKLSGKTYDKGLFILNGFLRERFSMDKPMSLSASVAFEQSYGGVDGDSASSTETYALLSAIADIPLDQSIAVTGSMNQNGEIQPIGGVNEKIEGYFLACKAKKLTGRQGVIIPIQNVSDLMLSHEVVEAVRKRKFHIWAVSHVDEGMEVLTGVAAGVRGADGKFPADTLNGAVDTRLFKLAKELQDFGKEKKDDKKTSEKKDVELGEEDAPKESEDRKSGQKRRTKRRR
ncbi:MAG: AAA family ATPase, partial [Deltaproteobacteria bacterium]|nr:AAA family ATPase [Deltaproteobacteria bacterium]